MARTIIQEFKKYPEDDKIRLVVGVDDNPEKANNAMFYVRMQSLDTDGEPIKPRGIWLSNEELRTFSHLLEFIREYCEENTLEKDTAQTKRIIKKLKRHWERQRDNL
jgi:hypothetical protein